MAPTSKIARCFPIFLLLTLAFSMASALEFNADYQTINSNIIVGTGSFATYTLTIKNLGTSEKTFNIRTLDSLDWDVYVEPSTNNRVEIDTGQEGAYLLRINEVKKDGQYTKNTGTYRLSAIVEADDEKVTLPVFVSIVSREALNRPYLPDVLARADLNVKKIDPRSKANLKLYLQNLNLRNITRLDIRITSEKGTVQQSGVASLGPLEEKVLDFTLNLKPDETPKQDNLFVRVETVGDDDQIYPKKQPDPIAFEIISYSTIVRDTRIEKKFLKKVTEITVSNDGNQRKEAEIKVEATLLSRLFTSTEPKADFTRENGNYYYVWNIPLDGRDGSKVDTEVLKVTNNYRPLFMLAIFGIVGLIFYYRFRSPIVITKDVSKILTKEGGIAGLKIIIHLKNRSNRTIENLKIVDRIPTITELEKDFEAGTLKPTNVTKGRTAISIMWEIASLEPFEERLITYHIRSKLSVLGGFDLQHAVAKYVTRKGRETIVTSNRIELSKKLIE